MDPFSIGLVAAQVGVGAFGAFNDNNEAKQKTRAANQQIAAKNRFSQQNWQYNEQMRQRQNRNARAIYEMRKQEYQLQKELDYDAYKEYFEDSQLQFNTLVRDVKAKSFQSAMKLAEYQGKAAMSSFSRGVTGRRAGLRAGNAALKAGIEQQSRADKLVFAEQQMERGIDRSRRRTDLRIQQAYNRIGPAPEDLPMAPQPLMGQMQRGPSDIGLFTDLMQVGLSGLTTYKELAAPSAGKPKTPAPRTDIPSNELSSAGQVGWQGRGGMR
jgi:hypothetical protein